ncbi:MAG: ATP-binding protein, partial [Dehalococcoidia bacterium]|nr:ATP-binding protein [Dehalococcoidia bacterium]
MKLARYEVPADKCTQHCDPKLFDFECTRDLAPLREFIGQERAIRGIRFGLSMKNRGYNIYVAGLSGTGKTSMVKTYINKLIEKRQLENPVYPDDWCYLHNFADSDRPQILSLPQGKGKVFRDQISNFLQQLKDELAKAFSSEEYKAHRKSIVGEGQAGQQKLFAEIGEEARRQGFVLQVTPVGPALIPVMGGKPMTEDEYMNLGESARKDLEAKRNVLLKKLQTTFEQAHELERQTTEKLQNTDKAVADYTVSRLFEHLIKEYQKSEAIIKYLNDLKTFTLNNLDLFKTREEQPPQAAMFGLPAVIARGVDPFLPFQVNVFVDNSGTKGPPVIIESNPIFSNMFGKIERRFLFGAYLSDHTMLKPGALHLASGGYLLLSAQDVLINPAVWPTLKRCIKNLELRIEDPFEQFGLLAPQGIRAEPMPIKVKIVLIGDAELYQLLAMYDEDFWEIFKVKADFNFEVEKTEKNVL